jgi:hypothetical protein
MVNQGIAERSDNSKGMCYFKYFILSNYMQITLMAEFFFNLKNILIAEWLPEHFLS